MLFSRACVLLVAWPFLLFARRRNSSWKKGRWGIPAGHHASASLFIFLCMPAVNTSNSNWCRRAPAQPGYRSWAMAVFIGHLLGGHRCPRRSSAEVLSSTLDPDKQSVPCLPFSPAIAGICWLLALTKTAKCERSGSPTPDSKNKASESADEAAGWQSRGQTALRRQIFFFSKRAFAASLIQCGQQGPPGFHRSGR